jgi:hypothetical protein
MSRQGVAMLKQGVEQEVPSTTCALPYKDHSDRLYLVPHGSEAAQTQKKYVLQSHAVWS